MKATRAYVVFEGTERIASINAVNAIIESHGLKPELDGSYPFKLDMIYLAMQLDESLRGLAMEKKQVPIL